MTTTIAKEFIAGTTVHRTYKTYKVYKPKVIVVTGSSIERIVGDFETKNKEEAFAAAENMVAKLKEV